jgi:ubiquitin C-terminal hydrolase
MGNYDEKDKKIQELLNREKMYKSQIERLEDKVAFYNEPILVGLNNIDACSYMNATLQCLLNTKKLTEYFLDNFKNNDPKKIMANEYYEVVLNLCKKENNKKSYSPFSFKEKLSKENPLFEGISAHDSKDLINFLIEKLHQELNVVNKNNTNNNCDDIVINYTDKKEVFRSFAKGLASNFNSPISLFFYAILESKTGCLSCKKVEYNFQIYNFLEFPLEKVNQYLCEKDKNRQLVLPNGKNHDVKLDDCFEYFGRDELMKGDNKMHCNYCDKLCTKVYSTKIFSFPNYLIINLNRGKDGEYECDVNFPDMLDVSKYASFKQGCKIYELYAVICHIGPSSMIGHFVAYCKNRIDNQWYLYNDALVAICTKPFQYNEGKPYILFYKSSSGGF